MDKQDIIRRMKEAGLKTPARGDFIFIHWDQIAMLIEYERKQEREACAKVCDDIFRHWLQTDPDEKFATPDADDCARAIRSRGETK